MISKIPTSIKNILNNLDKAGFEAFLVGGCVRDLMEDIQPKDWDVTTNAKPEEVMAIFPDSFYENDFGTVGVKIRNAQNDEVDEIVEVTTYRIEASYTDKRRPDSVQFAKTLKEDLKRRDFTINAMAARVNEGKIEIIDYFGGQIDLKNRIIRAVGEPDERFNEDALRMIRAVRFAVSLADGKSAKKVKNSTKGPKNEFEFEKLFEIEEKTQDSIKKNSLNLQLIAVERIQDEFNKIILSNFAAEGIDLLRKTGLLRIFLPELENCYGISQNRHHKFDIYEHLLFSLKNCPSGKLEVRLASLLHDIAKPRTKKGEGLFSTFFNHDHVGAKVTKKILERMKYSRDIIEKVTVLVSNHMFYYNVDEVGEASVRRLIKRVGLENINDLIDVRIADRLGSGVPKAVPYKLRHFKYMVDKVSTDPLSVKMLAINGNDLMSELEIEPGPMIGAILDVLLSEVLDSPERNDKIKLLERANELKHENIEKIRELAKEKIEDKKEEEDEEIKNKYWIK